MRSRAGSRGEHAHGVVDALGQGEPAGEGGVPQASQLLLRPVRRSGTDISAIISRKARFSQAAGPFDPGAPVHHVVRYARHEPGGQQDVHQVPDRHSRRRPCRRRHSWNRFPATTSRLALPVRRAGRHRCLPSPYRFRRRPGMDRLNRPQHPQPFRRSTSPKSRCAALCGAHHAPMFARSTGGQHGKLSKG